MMEQLSEQETLTVSQCGLVCGILGALGSTGIISTYHMSSRFRTPIARILYFNAYGDFIGCIGHSLGLMALYYPPGDFWCQFQALLVQTGYLWSLLGIGLIGVNLMLIVVKRISLRRIRRLNYIFFAIVAALAIINGVVPYLVYTTEQGGFIYVPMAGWCWLSGNYIYLQIIQLHFPICFVFLSNSMIFFWVGKVYHKVYMRMKNNPREVATRGSVRRYLKRYTLLAILFTIIYIFCWISIFINRMLVFSGTTVYFIVILRDVCTPLRGVFNLVLFYLMATFTAGESPVPPGQPLDVYKLHVISGEEPPSPNKPFHEFTKSYDAPYALYPYMEGAAMPRPDSQNVALLNRDSETITPPYTP
ncbi:hypothetical protein BDF19DRAFT_201533 [Syncephalis fuscata]|nr:hypothetical protein BDF19DRAFT_201533 [Syncephalis fuscata]